MKAILDSLPIGLSVWALPDGVAAEDADPLDMVLPWTIRCAVAPGAGVQSVLDTLEQSR